MTRSAGLSGVERRLDGLAGVAGLALLVWIWLALLRGAFWRAGRPGRVAAEGDLRRSPATGTLLVCAVPPATTVAGAVTGNAAALAAGAAGWPWKGRTYRR